MVLLIDIPQVNMGQDIQEWTKQNLWKTAFKKLYFVYSCIL